MCANLNHHVQRANLYQQNSISFLGHGSVSLTGSTHPGWVCGFKNSKTRLKGIEWSGLETFFLKNHWPHTADKIYSQLFNTFLAAVQKLKTELVSICEILSPVNLRDSLSTGLWSSGVLRGSIICQCCECVKVPVGLWVKRNVLYGFHLMEGWRSSSVEQIRLKT